MKGKPWKIPVSEKSFGACEGPPLPTTVKTNKRNPRSTGFSLQFWKGSNTTANHSINRRWQDELNNPRVRRPHHLLYSSSGRRASAALLSVFICTTMLTYMVTLFSTKLRTIESELASNGLLESSESARSLLRPPSGISTAGRFHSGRRLASTLEKLQNEPSRRNPPRILERFRRTFASRKLALSLLSDQNRTTRAITTFFGSQLAYVSPLTTLPKPNEGDDAYTTVISVYHVRNGRPDIYPIHSHRGVRSDQTRQIAQPIMGKTNNPPVHPGIASHYQNQVQTRPNARQTDPLTSISNELPINPFKSAGLNKRQESIPSTKVGRRSNEPPRLPQPVNQQREKGATNLKGEKSKVRQGMGSASLSQGMIEIWMLHSGSLCRIYNVGRLAGGQLILPEWMKKHSLVLLHQCGVKDPIYAIKSKINDKKFIFEKKRLNVTGRVRVIDNSNMDLVGTSVPRHHMPHFVSDILFPLRVTELLKGSGNGIEKLSFIRKGSSANSPEVIRAAFADLKPSLFLRAETWQANSTAWVQRLANFFSHPPVGFTLLSEEDRRRTKQMVPYDKNNAVWRFRSVLSDNSNLYEGEGLFDMNGNNFVFSRNGLSGAPAWTIKGISQEPCRVSVTALTRAGSRALLHLDVLKKAATKLFATGGLVLDFKVVKFDNAGFKTQVTTMRGTNVLIATHGAGNTNVIFMRRGATVIEVFPFAYRAGPFDGLARIFGLEYKAAMSAPQTKVFKECMDRYEDKDDIRKQVFGWWDKAVAEEKLSPWVHRLELEKEFGEPGKSEGMATRRCVRMQQLAFNTKAVAAMAFESAKRQCNDFRFRSKSAYLG